MNDNMIYIEANKSITGLAGFDFGNKMYEEQVKGKIDFNGEIILVFPENIQRFASSFIQGFFEDFVTHIGISGIENNVKIESSNKKLKEKIINDLL